MIPIAGWVAPFGYPRIKACSRLPMAFRSVPRPSSPPGAKASTECPSRAQSPHMHRNHPQPGQPHARDDHAQPNLHTAHLTTTRNPRRMGHKPTRVRPTRIAVRPDAHQPLHTDKEQTEHGPPPPRRRQRASHDRGDPIRIPSATTTPAQPWWRRTGSNRRPPACKAGALPAELRPQHVVVGQGGLEPPTPRLSSVCSNQLSY